MSRRTISTISRRYSLELSDALMSLIAVELLHPPPYLYLVSAWVTDVSLLDTTYGQFRTLIPEGGSEIHLSTILNVLADRGVAVHVAVRRVAENQVFVDRLHQPPIEVRMLPELHSKMLVTEHFLWEGSMNFTWSGMHSNPEQVIVSNDKGDVARALLNVQRLFGDTV